MMQTVMHKHVERADQEGRVYEQLGDLEGYLESHQEHLQASDLQIISDQLAALQDTLEELVMYNEGGGPDVFE